MKAAVAERPTETTEAGEYFERIPIGNLLASPTNPRTHFNDVYLDELARSIAEKGLIQPIVVRPLDSLRAIGLAPEAAATRGRLFEIVAGECRFRSAGRAGLTVVPAIVRAYTDEQVLEVQLIENIHRTDLTPLEQAAGYRRLIDTNPTKHSAESIAARIGMSAAWVWDRLKLNDLIPEAKALLESERMAVGHAIVVSRQKPEHQKRIIEPGTKALFVPLEHGLEFDGRSDPQEKPGKYDDVKPVTVRELEAWIARHIRFDVEHAAKAVPLQFEQTAQDVKHAAALPGRGKKVIAITFDHLPADDAKDPNERTYGVKSWRRADGTKKTQTIGWPPRLADSPTCEHSVLGVVAVGDDHYGETFQVCIARDRCQVHWKKEIAEREKNQKLRESGKGKQAAKNETRAEQSSADRWKREAEERRRKYAAWDAIRERALEALATVLQKAGPNGRVIEALAKTLDLRADDRKLFDRVIGKITAKNIAVALLFGTIVDDASRDLAEFQRVVKPFDVDLKALEVEYRAALAPAKPAAPKAEKKSAAPKAKTRKAKRT